MDRRYPQRPMVGVGAVILRGEEVLLVQRGSEPSYGKWSLPGGLVEVGESLHAAIEREVMEEVGLRVEVGEIVAVLDRVIKDQEGRVEYHYILIDFLCEAAPGEPVPETDALACAFVGLDALEGLCLTEGTKEIIRRSFALKEGRRYPAYELGL